jgi:tRNA threonylcarbamoyladenosine biosynthesis protein TsaE
MDIEVHSLAETKALAETIAQKIQGKTVTLCLDGDLGAGKTTFTQALGKALGVTKPINSPTFTIMKSYKMADGRPFWHLDAYRLEGLHQDLGFEDCFDEGIAVVEWSGFLKDQLPDACIYIAIENGTDQERRFHVEGVEL